MKLEAALKRLREVIRRKHLAISTEDTYCGWLARYARHLATEPDQGSRERNFEAFLTRLAVRDGVGPTTQNQAFNAILFFYKHVVGGEPLGEVNSLRAKPRLNVRHAPSVEETLSLLAAVRDVHGYPTRLLTHLLYGCGLRVSEPLNLRIKDVRLAESRLVIRQAKGGKDRVVGLPCSLVPALQAQLLRAELVWQIDRAAGVPVALPDGLARKYPSARFARSWAWVFPSKEPCHHPRTREIVRWRCHEANVQRAVKAAAIPLGLDTVVTPHVLRHAYATHAMDRGAGIHDVQAAMGHVSLETTAGYLHAHAERVASPLACVPFLP